MAVYTEVDPAALTGFLAAYDVGDALELKGIASGVENSNFRLTTTRGRFILTLYEKRVAPSDLPFFLGLMDHLAARDVPCPIPVHGTDGRSLRPLCGRPAAMVTFLEGRSPYRVAAEHCRALGEALARLHLAAADFAPLRPNALSVAGWRPLYAASAARASEVTPGLDAEIAAELDVMERDWPADLPRGVVHADLFPDNVFFQGNRLTGLIDFYFACDDIIAYDLAVCLNAWCFEPDGQFNVTKARHLLRGYRSVRPFTAEETASLPLLARGAALRFLLTRLHDWLYPAAAALVRPKDPLEYLRKLRFHRAVAGPGAYGLDDA